MRTFLIKKNTKKIISYSGRESTSKVKNNHPAAAADIQDIHEEEYSFIAGGPEVINEPE